ncbi:multidrug effflux MFS transporter [Sandaracinobacteroides saxicola]|uniref:Bcr/CflA family efflux transporter n=1 Tax=Sandaracinobacteroides saxicola TaxID=2759707 RepID=A0A7G5IHW5_9SPHN|nr:multidrug effflux MFS transporter [Sandaracinobacteroides saxicola]QMW22957.1 multidrug effflux MFS transporter [Sandaracinobacteroides saxicola]
MNLALPTRTRRPGLGEILLLGCLTAFGAISIDLYIPALPTIAQAFATDTGHVQLSMSVFFLGMAVGQLIYGPLSDRIGRRPPLLIGCTVYALASLLCAAAPSLEWLIAGRLAQALGACAGLVVARAIVRDRYDTVEGARLFSLLTLVLAVAPMLAPSLGGLLLHVSGWRSIFIVLALFGGLLGLAVWRRLEESRSSLTAATAAAESPLSSYAALFRNRRLIGFLLAGAFNGAALFTYVAGASPVFLGHYGVSTATFGWIFAVNAAGLIAASQVNRWLLGRYPPARIIAIGSIGSSLGGLLLVALALTGAGGMAGMMAALFVTLTSYGFVSTNSTALALAQDPARAGAISAMIGGASFGFGAVASSTAAALYDGTPLAMAAVMAAGFAFSSLALFGLARR